MRNWFGHRSEIELPLPAPWGLTRKRIALGLAGAVLLGLLGWQGVLKYRPWREKQLLQQAQRFAEQADDRSAVLNLRQVLGANQTNLAATRLMAELADRNNSPAAVVWRSRVVELEPDLLRNKFAWADTALRLGQPALAEQALALVGPAGRATAEFNRLAAALAMVEKNYPAAEAHFAQVVRLEPANETNQLNLATVRLLSARPQSVGEALATLERLRAHPEFGGLALRALASDALRKNDLPQALRLTALLAEHPRAAFEDQLLRLEALTRSRQADFNSRLAVLQNQSSGEVRKVFELLVWMNAHGLATQALDWGKRLPTAITTEQPVPIALAEAHSVLRDWANLKLLLEFAQWQEMDFMRLAILSRVARETGQAAESRTRWRMAMIRTGDHPPMLAMLAKLVQGWGWDAEAEELWWKLAASDRGQRQALQSLYRLYTAHGNTRQLHRVSLRILALKQSDPVAMNNVAMLSLLLNQNVEQAHRLALMNHRFAPTNPVFVSTYAMSLHLQGKTAEGLPLLAALPERVLCDPSFAATYGILLAAKSQQAKRNKRQVSAAEQPFLSLAAREERELAWKYLELADQKKQLLPEEQTLVTEAKKQLKSP